jgi:hypothetical protein
VRDESVSGLQDHDRNVQADAESEHEIQSCRRKTMTVLMRLVSRMMGRVHGRRVGMAAILYHDTP